MNKTFRTGKVIKGKVNLRTRDRVYPNLPVSLRNECLASVHFFERGLLW
jgi:hypothetical protein